MFNRKKQKEPKQYAIVAGGAAYTVPSALARKLRNADSGVLSDTPEKILMGGMERARIIYGLHEQIGAGIETTEPFDQASAVAEAAARLFFCILAQERREELGVLLAEWRRIVAEGEDSFLSSHAGRAFGVAATLVLLEGKSPFSFAKKTDFVAGYFRGLAEAAPDYPEVNSIEALRKFGCELIESDPDRRAVMNPADPAAQSTAGGSAERPPLGLGLPSGVTMHRHTIKLPEDFGALLLRERIAVIYGLISKSVNEHVAEGDHVRECAVCYACEMATQCLITELQITTGVQAEEAHYIANHEEAAMDRQLRMAVLATMKDYPESMLHGQERVHAGLIETFGPELSDPARVDESLRVLERARRGGRRNG